MTQTLLQLPRCCVLYFVLFAPVVCAKDMNSALITNSTKKILFQESMTISGTVISGEDNESLPGVNVTIKGTNQGTVTDVNGEYSLEVSSQEAILVFSYVGYLTEEVQVKSQTVIDITLVPDVKSLQEIVVVGYGTQSKVSLTSSVGEIDGEELVRRPVSNLQQALQGKITGLTILDNGGSPGSSNTNILVRGVNTPYTPVGLGAGANAVIGDNGPLVIIDGIEQPYQNINPDDIESISVLKDASSTAIYGSRAANGVLLITTKRGKSGKVSVTYDGFYASQRAVDSPEHMEIEDYLRLQNVAYQNVGSNPKYTEQEIQQYVRGTKNDPLHYPLPYDWYNVMLNPAPQVNHAISISGGTENFRSRMSVRHQDQEGIIANTESKLTEVRVNTDFTVSPKINISADLDYRYEDVLQPNNITNIFRLMMQNAIWAVPKYPDGTYGGGTQGNSPLLLAENGGTDQQISNYVLGNIKGEWEIIKGLKFSTQLALRSTNLSEKDYIKTWQTQDSTTIKKSNKLNKLNESRIYNREITLNSLLNYSTNFGDHSLKVLAGYSQIDHTNSSLSAYRQDFYNNDVQSIGQGANDATKDNGGSDYDWGLISYFGRINYAYMDKYFFEANARYDGSSRFSENNRYSFFPSFSVGWRLSEENFWEGLKEYISDFKIRASWGETGNQAVALYSYFPTLDLVTYDFNGTVVPGYTQKQLSDPGLSWETTTQTDIGLDGDLLDGKVTVTVDYYKKQTDDILLTLPVPGVLGLQAGPQNAGKVENRGWEFSVGNHTRMGKVGLDANLNFSINTNEVLDLAGTGPYIYGDDIDPRYITGEGYPINAFWGYKTDGLFQTEGEASSYPEFMRPAKPGDVKVLDLNEDGKIDPSDMTVLGNSYPTYTFGAGFNITYSRFVLNLAFQGAADVDMRIARALGEQGNYEGFTPDIYADNYWTPEHTDAEFARPTKQDLRNQASTDKMLVDASYFRLKNIQLMYDLPADLIQKIFVQHARIYVSATNLLTFSELNKWHLDPESSSGWQNYYPQTALYTVGVNLQF